MAGPLLEITDLAVDYRVGGGSVAAVFNVCVTWARWLSAERPTVTRPSIMRRTVARSRAMASVLSPFCRCNFCRSATAAD